MQFSYTVTTKDSPDDGDSASGSNEMLCFVIDISTFKRSNNFLSMHISYFALRPNIYINHASLNSRRLPIPLPPSLRNMAVKLLPINQRLNGP